MYGAQQRSNYNYDRARQEGIPEYIPPTTEPLGLVQKGTITLLYLHFTYRSLHVVQFFLLIIKC